MADITSLHQGRFMFSIIVFGCIYFGVCLATTVSITENSGYKNVTVAIGERVPQDASLLQKIKDDFTEASGFLFKATQRRFYFSEITILVPRSWSNVELTDTIRSERFESSDFIIDVSQEDRPDRPFTNKNSGCGQPGQYINFTPKFIMDRNEANKYGGYGKTIVHEWAHYRWGVFDEYPRPGSSHFYASYNGHYEATRCTTAIPGRYVSILSGKDDDCDRNKGEPPEHCRFQDDEVTGRYTASLLYKQFMSKISDFCDRESNGNDVDSAIRHNREAPNQQNIHCFGKSTRQVIREHSDFNNQPNQLSDRTDTTPTFKTVQPTVNYWVLVLDTSGSMRGERLRQLRQAASNFINTAVQIGEQLSIISFNGSVTLNAPLTRIVDDKSRQNLIETLPINAGGTSNIGEGIQMGRAQLVNKDIFAGRMLVITDGEETVSPFIKDIIHLLTDDTPVTVDTIAIGSETTPNLELLARETGGQSFYHSDSSTTLDEAFKEFSERNRGASDSLITVFTKYLVLDPNQMDSSDIIIDPSIGEDTQFLFDYSQGEASVDGVLTRPDGTLITKSNTLEYLEDSSFSLTRINLDGTASRTGVWKLMLTNTSPHKQNVTIIVQSRASKDNNGNTVDPIKASATWANESVDIMDNTVDTNNQTIFVTVSKGYIPILYATVTATVTVPEGQPLSFDIYDNGLGADIQENDGIYSAFLTEFQGEGRYGLSVMIENRDNKAIISHGSVLGQGSIINPDDEMTWGDRPAGPFQRVVNGGSFTCSGMLCSGITDVFPPARILDLKASVFDLTKAEATLTYTSVGDNLMTGTVWNYELRRSLRDINILYDDFENADLVSTFVASQPAGTIESFTVSDLMVGPHSYFFAIVAIDHSGHRSLVSNIASASMRFVNIPGMPVTWTEPPTTTPRIISTTQSGSSEVSTTSGTNMTATKEPLYPVGIAIAIAAPIVAILVAALLIALCLLCKKRRNTPPKPVSKEDGMPEYGNVNRSNLPDLVTVPSTRDANLVYRTEPSVDNTRDAEVMFRPGTSMDNTRDADVMFRSGASTDNTRNAEVMFRSGTSTDNTRDAELLFRPEKSMEATRNAKLMSNKPLPPEPTPLDTKVDVAENFYSGLPEKRTGYPDGGAGGSGLTRARDGTYMDMSHGTLQRQADDSSDSEDEITREKRRIHELQMQDPEYY